MALAPLGGADPRREGLQLLERVHAEAAEPLHQAVQHVDGGAGVGQGPVVGRGGGVEDPGERGDLQLGASSRVITRRASLAVSSTSNRGHGRPAGGRSAGGSRRRTARCGPPGRSRPRTRGTPAAPDSIGGASATIVLVMPVRTAMNAGISVCGLTSVWNSPSTSPPRTLTAPISVIIEPRRGRAAGRLEVDDAERQVAQGRPSSSKLRCDSQREVAPGRRCSWARR